MSTFQLTVKLVDNTYADYYTINTNKNYNIIIDTVTFITVHIKLPLNRHETCLFKSPNFYIKLYTLQMNLGMSLLNSYVVVQISM